MGVKVQVMKVGMKMDGEGLREQLVVEEVKERDLSDEVKGKKLFRLRGVKKEEIFVKNRGGAE